MQLTSWRAGLAKQYREYKREQLLARATANSNTWSTSAEKLQVLAYPSVSKKTNTETEDQKKPHLSAEVILTLYKEMKKLEVPKIEINQKPSIELSRSEIKKPLTTPTTKAPETKIIYQRTITKKQNRPSETSTQSTTTVSGSVSKRAYSKSSPQEIPDIARNPFGSSSQRPDIIPSNSSSDVYEPTTWLAENGEIIPNAMVMKSSMTQF